MCVSGRFYFSVVICVWKEILCKNEVLKSSIIMYLLKCIFIHFSQNLCPVGQMLLCRFRSESLGLSILSEKFCIFKKKDLSVGSQDVYNYVSSDLRCCHFPFGFCNFRNVPRFPFHFTLCLSLSPEHREIQRLVQDHV